MVTGRTADSALALAPCIHKLNWDMSDFDLMASGSLAGHLIECGGQVMEKHLSFCTHFIRIMGTSVSDLGGETPFNKLWLLLDFRAELNLRLTK